jgi:hypothetical protein
VSKVISLFEIKLKRDVDALLTKTNKAIYELVQVRKGIIEIQNELLSRSTDYVLSDSTKDD